MDISGMRRYEGKRVIITGAASGIGAATARRMAAEGGSVACLDLSEDGLAETVGAITDAGGTATAHPVNVAEEEAVAAAVGAAVDAHGVPQVVCNIAGIGRTARSHEETLEQWNRVIAVNLTGTFLMCREVVPLMMEDGGVIVNTASTAGLLGHPWQVAYAASKGGVVQLTRSLAYEYEDTPIRVNAVAPGGVETPIIDEFAGLPEGASWKRLKKVMSDKGWCSPEEAAGTFAYLASDEAKYVHGAIYSIDGGVTA